MRQFVQVTLATLFLTLCLITLMAKLSIAKTIAKTPPKVETIVIGYGKVIPEGIAISRTGNSRRLVRFVGKQVRDQTVLPRRTYDSIRGKIFARLKSSRLNSGFHQASSNCVEAVNIQISGGKAATSKNLCLDKASEKDRKAWLVLMDSLRQSVDQKQILVGNF